MIIGLSGAKRCGKDTTFSIIKGYVEDAYPNMFNDIIRVAFADPIKLTIQKFFDLKRCEVEEIKISDDVKIYCNGKNMGGVKGRDFIRSVGMLMRDYDDNQFVNYVKEIVQANSQNLYIITDVRFDNEVKFIEEYNGKIILIKRDGLEIDNHISEKGIVKYDYVLYNNNIKNLKNDVKIIMDNILTKRG